LFSEGFEPVGAFALLRLIDRENREKPPREVQIQLQFVLAVGPILEASERRFGFHQ
jgi:hypothetical protein